MTIEEALSHSSTRGYRAYFGGRHCVTAAAVRELNTSKCMGAGILIHGGRLAYSMGIMMEPPSPSTERLDVETDACECRPGGRRVNTLLSTPEVLTTQHCLEN